MLGTLHICGHFSFMTTLSGDSGVLVAKGNQRLNHWVQLMQLVKEQRVTCPSPQTPEAVLLKGCCRRKSKGSSIQRRGRSQSCPDELTAVCWVHPVT